MSVETRTFVSTCAGTKFGSCGARAEWDDSAVTVEPTNPTITTRSVRS